MPISSQAKKQEREKEGLTVPSAVVALSGKMADRLMLASVFVSFVGVILFYVSYLIKNGRPHKSASITTKSTSISTECRSGDETDVIIVGAGVAGAALALTLAKVQLQTLLLFSSTAVNVDIRFSCYCLQKFVLYL